MGTSDGILTVRELTEQLRARLEGAFPFVWVRGEVSNLMRPGSGHIYFCLKDQDAQIHCVWFSQQQRRTDNRRSFDILTGEVYDGLRPSPLDTLRNGVTMLCAGRISVYAGRGQYQLVVELVQAEGQGALALAFEERKRKLAALGYFSGGRKRLLPRDAKRVALITSASGAAIHDFLTLGAQRGSGTKICLFPALVQGAAAASEIATAMQRVNDQDWAQVIVLIRGGGSLEDLWPFNEESVAEAVFQSRIPVLAGIGHEVDTTLADMTADMRAATPSHAAQLLWPPREEFAQRLDDAHNALRNAMASHLIAREHLLQEQVKALRWLSPLRHFARLCERLERMSINLVRALPRRLADVQRRLAHQQASLRTCIFRSLERRVYTLDHLTLLLENGNPAAPLEKGYALALTVEGEIVSSISRVLPGQKIYVRLKDGRLSAIVGTVGAD
ncbi:MAG: exodeoxyribonuclease VII large subunit [Desulfovibrio sp.]|jgi:exodeoxyribonuclease VII large subunit|nr:exodeoxyribonuclease VII large subunit [Desulfovibrio sp.]